MKKNNHDKRVYRLNHNQPENHEAKLTIGSFVSIEKFNLVGEIKQINKSTVVIHCSNISLEVSINDIKPVSAPIKSSPKPNVKFSTISKTSSIESEIDLHGYTVEEAITAIERHIDKSILLNKKNLKIIHGKGTGILRNAVRKYLSSHKSVISIYNEDGPYIGGIGVTFIELE